jgi:hypothetical protein
MGGVRQVSFGDDATRDGGVVEFVRQATEGGVEERTALRPIALRSAVAWSSMKMFTP